MAAHDADKSNVSDSFNASGFLILPDVLTHAQCDDVINALPRVQNSSNISYHRFRRD
jgi:hypothetical protein